MPTLVPSGSTLSRVGVISVSPPSSGMRVTAVSTFCVLAGRKCLCGLRAASTSPVSASAMIQDPALIFFSGASGPAAAGTGASATVSMAAAAAAAALCGAPMKTRA